MRWPLISRLRHDRELTAVRLAHLAERTGWTHDASNFADQHVRAALADKLERVAGSHDQDARHLDARANRPVGSESERLNATGHRAVRNALLDAAREVRDPR